MLRQTFVYLSVLCVYACVSVCKLQHTCLHVHVHVCAWASVHTCVRLSWRKMFATDAFAPRTLSGVPVKSRWAATVGTYMSPQGNAIGLNDETHQSSSQPGLTCPSVLFMVACPW